MPPARIASLEMEILGFPPLQIPCILLGGVQETGLVEGFFNSEYSELRPPSEEMEPGWEKGTKTSTHKKCFPPPQPEILGGREGRYLESSFQLSSSW